MKKLVLAVLCIATLAIGACAFASDDINIETYDQWVTEIGPGGHLAPILAWNESLEFAFPGQSASFKPATLSAIPDLDGEPALSMAVGESATETVITGWTFTSTSIIDYQLRRIRFSIYKSQADKDTVEVILKDKKGKKCYFLSYIPKMESPFLAWANIVIPGTGYWHCEDGFDITTVDEQKGIDFVVRRYGKKEEEHYKVDNTHVDHFNNTIPEPSSMLMLGSGLVGLAGVMLRGRR